MIDTSKTVTGVMVNGTSMNVGGGGGGGAGSMQAFIDLRNATEIEGMVMGCSFLFSGLTDLTNETLPTIMDGVDTSEVENWIECFANTGLTEIPALDFSNAVACSNMFYFSAIIGSVGFNMPNIESADYMFGYCSGLDSFSFEEGTTDNLINVEAMFDHCASLTSVEFEATNVENATYMFLNCSSLIRVVLKGIRVDFDISASEEFSASNLAITIANLGDVATDGNPSTGGYTATLTMGATNLAKLSQQDIDDAEAKGWTLV